MAGRTSLVDLPPTIRGLHVRRLVVNFYSPASANSSVSVISITVASRAIDMTVGFVDPRSILLMCARSMSAR